MKISRIPFESDVTTAILAKAGLAFLTWWLAIPLASTNGQQSTIIQPKTATATVYFPTVDQWESETADLAGADPVQLDKAVAYAGQHHSHALIIVKGGKLLVEEYWDGWNRDSTGPLYSASKSVMSTLIGIGMDQGHFQSLNQPCSDFLPEWKDDPSYQAIQLKHLLSMTSGLDGGPENFRRGILSVNERRFATQLPAEHPPGTVWDYHNSAYRLLFPILESATGKTANVYSKANLFGPLAMNTATWHQKKLGRSQYTFLEMSARDAARFGLLILRKGDWQGKSVVSSRWLQTATRPWDPEVHDSYGLLWWLNGGENHYLPLRARKFRGSIFPSCPADAFAALGKDDQKIYVVPSLDLVVVRLGEAADSSSPALSRFDDQLLGRICKAF